MASLGIANFSKLPCQGASNEEVAWESVFPGNAEEMCAFRVDIDDDLGARKHLACEKNNSLCHRAPAACRRNYTATDFLNGTEPRSERTPNAEGVTVDAVAAEPPAHKRKAKKLVP